MRLESLPNEVLFEVLYRLDYTDLLSLLEIPALAPKLKQFVRLVKSPGEEQNTFEPFKEFEKHIPFCESDTYSSYTIILNTSVRTPFYPDEFPSSAKIKLFTICHRLEDDEVVEDPSRTIHDRMNNRIFWPSLFSSYSGLLRPHTTLVTQQRAVSLESDIAPDCAIVGPDLKVLRLAGVRTASCTLFDGLKVTTLIVCTCSQEVLDLALYEAQHNPSFKTLDIIGIPRRSFGEYQFQIPDLNTPLGASVSGWTFDNLTKLWLRMMRSVTDITLPKVKELYITLITETPNSDSTTDEVMSRLENISGPEVTHLSLCFLTKIPINGGLDFPKCERLTASFELERFMSIEERLDSIYFAHQTTKYDPTTYASHINLPSSKKISLSGCAQFTKPDIFEGVEHLTISAGESTYIPLDNESMTGVILAPALKFLHIDGAGDSNLPIPIINAPGLKELSLHTREEYYYCFPKNILAQFPGIEVLEIYRADNASYAPASASIHDDFADVTFTNVHTFISKNISPFRLTDWMTTFKDNTLVKVEIGWLAAYDQLDFRFLDQFWVELGRQKKSLVELSLCLGSYKTYIHVPKMMEHYLQGFQKLTILSIYGAHNVIIKDCPELSMIAVNNEPETKGPPRLYIESIQLDNLPKLEKVVYRTDMAHDPKTGLKRRFEDGDEKQIIEIGEGVPESVLFENVCMSRGYQLGVKRRAIRSKIFELTSLVKCNLPHDRQLLVAKIEKLRKRYDALPKSGDLESDELWEPFIYDGPDIYLDRDEWNEHHEDDSDFDEFFSDSDEDVIIEFPDRFQDQLADLLQIVEGESTDEESTDEESEDDMDFQDDVF